MFASAPVRSKKIAALLMLTTVQLLIGCSPATTTQPTGTPLSGDALSAVTPTTQDEPSPTVVRPPTFTSQPETTPTDSAIAPLSPTIPAVEPSTTYPAKPENTPERSGMSTPVIDAEVKMMISGVVIDGGDTTPEGLLDAPRRFVYEVRQDSGEPILVSYVAYPPSPAAERPGPELSFFTGAIMPGHYLIASGTYDEVTNTVEVVDEGDYIETYTEKP